ncbi:MAG TPA: TetR/AcrR family transcriptional regulator [Nocardioides sp.]|uniref:TetR/AcrR family transcriptional regulator n=1 Tax=Nocardioides sp. TaxID=35761 RepID=UPI002CDAFFF3|nr:TetR/AcrR family transcriptional regulator [Nocardioides sp.]HQR28166.1 TetR/AcrR family transcriptional regulator [Nocardioides sp.]
MPTSTRTRPELSRERILDAALALVDREGEKKLTFRRLGAELGADPTACYRHFRSKDDLLLALGDRLLGDAMDQVPDGQPWRETLGQLGLAVFRGLLRHPRLAVLVGVRTTQGEQEARGIERVLAALESAGLSVPEAVDIWHAVGDTILAWAAFEATYAALPDDVRRQDSTAWTTTYRQAPADRYPHIAAAGPFLQQEYDAFPLALDLLLDAIAARLDDRRNP